MAQVLRNRIADYLDIGTTAAPAITLMGVGFNSLEEKPGTQVQEKTYVCDSGARKSTTGYSVSFAFDTDLLDDEEVIMALYSIARDQKVGANAEFDYYRVDLYDEVTPAGTYKARKFRVSVEVSDVPSGNGTEVVRVTGNLNAIQAPVQGTFATATKTFTPNP